MKEFITAAKAVDENDDEGILFTVDDYQFKAFRPTDGQIAVLMSAQTGYASDSTKVAAIINFFVGVLDTEAHQVLVTRLLDRDDPFDLEQVNAILEWLLEEWTGRPTKPSTGSTPSRRNGGRRSTENAQVVDLTPSASVSTDSAI